MYLPRYLTQKDDAVGTDDQAEAVGVGEKGEVILIVEDDQDLRFYLADVLRTLGYLVVTAANGEAALSLLDEPARRIDLLLTDVVMPGMNGRELGHRALALRPTLRVLYMSGYSRNAVVHHGRLDEGVELLQKPITQTHLAARVRDLLDRAKSSSH
jgi:DNA-binding response OmpR family regulator